MAETKLSSKGGRATPPYRVLVSQRFVVFSLLSCILVAFAIGRTARIFLVVNPGKEILLAHQAVLSKYDQTIEDSSENFLKLQTPVLQEGKILPQTTYTSKMFDTAKSSTIHSRWIVTEEGKDNCVDEPNKQCRGSNTNIPDELVKQNDTDENDQEVHLPKGQHLLIDIENVDSAFLNSEVRLANAMLELVSGCGLTLLSYHCHGLKPMGVSCAGVLLESHVSFHTWPTEGVITLDLFTCGDSSLLPIVSFAEKLFSIPQVGKTDTKPQMIWAHKLRGFGDADAAEDLAEKSDFFAFPIGQMTDYKQEVLSAETDFQRVDIYDVLRPHAQNVENYDKSRSGDGSYQATHPELFEPDRIVFLDGVLQSRRSGDAAYHEALVHPSMFAHKNPKRVAIIGGGEGATLREVLKHKTVEKVVMIEIDQKMVEMSRQFLPSWSDCSMLEGSTGSCFDDPRAEVYFEDAFAWFIDRFGSGVTGTDEALFDVIIMDALDPQVQKDFVDALYDGGPFLESLPNALSEDGIFTAQLGEAPSMISPSEEFSLDRNRVKFIRSLVNLGFQSIRDYEEPNAGFGFPWQYAVAFKSFDSKTAWFAEPSLVDFKIRQRMIPTIDGESPLSYFDGATMISYLFPSKTSEVAFCHRSSHSKDCVSGHGFDPQRRNLPLSLLEVKESSLGSRAGRGVFAREGIPKMSYIGLADLVHIVYMSPKAYELLVRMEHQPGDFRQGSSWWQEVVEIYSHGYGHSFSQHGGLDIFVDPTLQCFINHGCKGSNNVGHNLETTEDHADPNSYPKELSDRYFDRDVLYNPAAERQVHFYSSAVPLRDISAGEELFDNYLGMSGYNMVGWAEDVNGLKSQCEGSGEGVITEYENL